MSKDSHSPLRPPTSWGESLAERLSTLGLKIFHRRLHVGLSAVLLATLVFRPRPFFGKFSGTGFVISIVLVFLGLILRTWAGGCAGNHTRRATIEAPQLVTGGPFAYVRNPIYLASIILGVGMVGVLRDPWMLGLCLTVFVFLYGAIVPAEERFLRDRFGSAYLRYCLEVPRIIPRLRSWSGAERRPFDRTALFGEVRLGVLLVLIYAYLHAGAWVRMRFLGF